MKESPLIIVHNGTFHADDVFVVAALRRLYPSATVIRTRDEAIIATGDIVADVGGIYDASVDRFDHHQKGGAGARENGIPYAAIGLVWKKYGEAIAGGAEEAALIDARLIAAIDGPDNGVALAEPKFKETLPYHMGALIESWNPSWKEEQSSADERFVDAVSVASRILEREIIRARDAVVGFSLVKDAYAKAADKRAIILTQPDLPWRGILSSFPEPLFVVEPKNELWKVKAVSAGVFINRKNLPAAWAGLRDAELAAVTGVADATFCHNKLFVASAKSKDGALALLHLALSA